MRASATPGAKRPSRATLVSRERTNPVRLPDGYRLIREDARRAPTSRGGPGARAQTGGVRREAGGDPRAVPPLLHGAQRSFGRLAGGGRRGGAPGARRVAGRDGAGADPLPDAASEARMRGGQAPSFARDGAGGLRAARRRPRGPRRAGHALAIVHGDRLARTTCFVARRAGGPRPSPTSGSHALARRGPVTPARRRRVPRDAPLRGPRGRTRRAVRRARRRLRARRVSPRRRDRSAARSRRGDELAGCAARERRYTPSRRVASLARARTKALRSCPLGRPPRLPRLRPPRPPARHPEAMLSVWA